MASDYDLVDKPDAERVKSMRRPTRVTAPNLTISSEAASELRHGLGRVDMDIRWMFWLDDEHVLHLWRSWTGFEIYRASFAAAGDSLELRGLEVESDEERYSGDVGEEPDGFLRVLRAQFELLGLSPSD